MRRAILLLVMAGCLFGQITRDNVTGDQRIESNLEIGANVPAGAPVGTIAASIIYSPNGALNVKGFGAACDGSTADYTAINAALAAASSAAKAVYLPASSGACLFASTLVIPTGVSMFGDGTSSKIRWTGAASGTAISITDITNVALRNFELQTAVGYPSVGILVDNSSHVKISGVTITSQTGTNGFGTAIRSTGDGAATLSALIRLEDLTLLYYTGAGIALDHTQEVYLDDLYLQGVANDTGSQPLVVDTGVSGLYASNISTVYGYSGMEIRNAGTGGAYGGNPHYLFFDNFLADTTTGGDGIIFNANLGANTVDAKFENSWVSQAGLTNAGAVTTAGAVGIRLNGGSHIQWIGGSIAWSASHGIAMANANVQRVKFVGATIRDNDVNDAASTNGVHITAAVTDVIFNGCSIGNNFIGGESAGHQRYGIFVDAVAADRLAIVGNEFYLNETGPLSNGATGRYEQVGNIAESDVPIVFTALKCGAGQTAPLVVNETGTVGKGTCTP